MAATQRPNLKTRRLVILFLVALFVGPALSDDQFLCCMRGIRSIRSIKICPAPCCEGYQEKVVYPSKLGRISYCVKIPNYKQQKKPTPKYIPKQRKP